MRFDFVTNSSSSSFVCWGVSKDDIKFGEEIYLKLFNDYVSDNKGKSWFDLSEEEINQMSIEDKIDFVNDEIDTYDLYNTDLISIGGSENDVIGINPDTIIEKYPNEKIGAIKQIVADELNKKFETSFTKKDIFYFEEGWMDN